MIAIMPQFHLKSAGHTSITAYLDVSRMNLPSRVAKMVLRLAYTTNNWNVWHFELSQSVGSS